MKNKNFKLGIKREIGKVNWTGLITLYIKEVKRFTNVFLQTITAPMITTLLFVIVFSIAIDRNAGFHQFTFITFLVPGLIMMSVLQNSFANVSSAFMTAKVQGSIVDLLMAPLGVVCFYSFFFIAMDSRNYRFSRTFLLDDFVFNSRGYNISHNWYDCGYLGSKI